MDITQSAIRSVSLTCKFGDTGPLSIFNWPPLLAAMLRAQSRKSYHMQEDSPEPSGFMRNDESSESINIHDSPEPRQKDRTEIELERLVFGDELGFFDGLKSIQDDTAPGLVGEAETQAEGDETEETGEGLEGVDDADVRT